MQNTATDNYKIIRVWDPAKGEKGWLVMQEFEQRIMDGKEEKVKVSWTRVTNLLDEETAARNAAYYGIDMPTEDTKDSELQDLLTGDYKDE